ncbi:MAG: hypothetical protein M1835_003877 [Candelina submexicana]|nr:MAG: hypothetical protein M1835_003877 [Candelina submexicana]
MVDLAVSSMALAVYARTQQHPQAIIEASLTYQRLLGVAQERIVSGETISVDEQNLDAFLLAILLMGRYEGVMHRSNDIKSSGSFKSFQSWSHHDGAMAILKVWKGNPNRAPATKIIQQTRRGLIRSSLLRNLPLPQWILDGVCFGEDAKGYDNIFTRAVNLHHAMLSLQENDEDHTAQAADLVLELRKLEEALQDWVARFPSSWSYQRHTLTIVGPWPRKHFFSPVVLSYTELGYGVVWSPYFATSILINSVRWRVLKFSPLKRLVGSLYEQQQLECISQLSAMADELASTIPFVLGRIKVLDDSDSSSRQPSIKLNMKEEIKPHLASLAVWPLTIASSLEGINIRQQLWFRCELATLGRTLGASVLECAETSEWATL